MDARIATICEQVAEGQTIRQIAAHLGCSPGRVLQVINEGGDEAAKQYARARDMAADLFESDIIMHAEASTPATAAADRIKVDALKWVAARRAPKRYSERLVQEISGTIATRDMTDDELDRAIAAAAIEAGVAATPAGEGPAEADAPAA